MKILIASILFLLLGAGFIVFLLSDKKPYENLNSTNSNEHASNSETNGQKYEEKNFHPVSLPAMFKKEFVGTDFTVGNVLATTANYTRYYITYKSGELIISGIMNVPKGTPPEDGFPLLILNHGYIDPAIYTNGRGLRREQDYLANQGFVVIHPDYRNHAQSSKDENSDFNFRLGYVEDVINAVLAVKNANLSYINTNRVGMLGHSMGGGVTMNAAVVKPNLIKAAVLYAPVSSSYIDNFERWTRPDSSRRSLAEKIIAEYGEPTAESKFWQDISVSNFFDRLTVPTKIFHGTKDESVPVEWSYSTEDKLKLAGKPVDLVIYENEKHEFSFKWQDFMQQSAKFFQENL